MSSNSASKNKRQEEKYIQMIRELASLPMNKQCFDCNSKGPTYVDVTVGSFVCTTCSGLLRGLNPPHRVKSINMSTFSQDEVEFMRSHGNQLNKMIYLNLYDANAGFSPDSKDTERFKEFLSQKYERKRWYAEPTETMKQKVKIELEACLEKNNQAKSTSSSAQPQSRTIATGIKSPPESTITGSSTVAPRTTKVQPVSTSQQPPMLVFDAPVSSAPSTASSTSLFDDFLQTSTTTTQNASPTKNFFSDHPFGSNTPSSNDSNWGAFVEPVKQPTSLFNTTGTVSPTKPLTMSAATVPNHPPPEPADKYAAFSELFSTQATIQDSQPAAFNSANSGGSRSSISTTQNSLFGNNAFSSMPPTTNSTNSNVGQKFSSQQSTNLFTEAPFSASSNPFMQSPFGTNSSNLFAMPSTSQPNPFLNIAQQHVPAQTLPNQFGKPQTNSTNPFL